MDTRQMFEPDLLNYWEYFLEEYAEPIGLFLVSMATTLYLRLTLINIAIFTLKYVPTGLYMYKLAKGVYVHTRRRIQQKKVELKEVQLEIELVNTKLCTRDVEIQERTAELQRATEHLTQLRALVRQVIASSTDLQKVLDNAEHSRFGSAPPSEIGSRADNEFVNDLIKELQKGWASDTKFPEKEKRMECGEPDLDATSTDSVYSSIVDGVDEMKQDCRVRIVKVTNVYKVAYLRNYIKQKRLRRASKQALLKKKMEGVKKLLEDWQKALNTVVNTNLSLVDGSQQIDADYQDNDDYPKFTFCSGSDSDFKEVYFEQNNLRWQYSNSQFSCDDFNEPDTNRDAYLPEMNREAYLSDMNREVYLPDMNREAYVPDMYRELTDSYPQAPVNVLFVLPEETNSQLAIEESRSENGQMETTDME